MRVAISIDTNDGLDSIVAHHFGRCPFFALVDLEGDEIKEVEVVENPHYAHHQPGEVPGFIHEHNANVMLSGGMGRRAIDFFQQYGIEIATGANGTVRNTLQEYMDGKLIGAAPCRESVEHEHGHQH